MADETGKGEEVRQGERKKQVSRSLFREEMEEREITEKDGRESWQLHATSTCLDLL
jgi:hypothetical protein